tara:strand:- start:1115 stop:2086 length:972 start_codon:yes stop_codon:yes gene_type:complete
MKIECYDLTKSLETTKKQLEESNAQKESSTQAHEKTCAKFEDVQKTFKYGMKCYESQIDQQGDELTLAKTKVTALAADLRRLSDDYAAARVLHAAEMTTLKTDHKKTYAKFVDVQKTYESQINDQGDELTLANIKVTALASDVMQQAVDLRRSSDDNAAVHDHYAAEMTTLKTALGNKQRAEEQEITAGRENNKRLLCDNLSLKKSNHDLKTSLQNERAKKLDIMSDLKKINKRSRYIYEQQAETITAMKKRRVTLRWNGSMPKRLQERLTFKRSKDAWVEFKCQWLDYFGETRVRAHYTTGPVIYKTLDGFIYAIRKRANKN